MTGNTNSLASPPTGGAMVPAHTAAGVVDAEASGELVSHTLTTGSKIYALNSTRHETNQSWSIEAVPTCWSTSSARCSTQNNVGPFPEGTRGMGSSATDGGFSNFSLAGDYGSLGFIGSSWNGGSHSNFGTLTLTTTSRAKRYRCVK